MRRREVLLLPLPKQDSNSPYVLLRLTLYRLCVKLRKEQTGGLMNCMMGLCRASRSTYIYIHISVCTHMANIRTYMFPLYSICIPTEQSAAVPGCTSRLKLIALIKRSKIRLSVKN